MVLHSSSFFKALFSTKSTDMTFFLFLQENIMLWVHIRSASNICCRYSLEVPLMNIHNICFCEIRQILHVFGYPFVSGLKDC